VGPSHVTNPPEELSTRRPAPVAISTDHLVVRYGAGNAAVHDVSLEVRRGEVVALLGANGAGKTSTIHALAGEVPAAGGTVLVSGEKTSAPLHRRVRQGIGLLTEERCVFTGLTVRDNLRLGRGSVSDALDLFPELHDHLDRPAGLLSGGQQQMLALGRVLAARPSVLLADELSLGLAPVIVQRLLKAVRAAADSGVAVLLVEQHVHLAIEAADHVYVLRRGKVVHDGAAAPLRGAPDAIAELYLDRAEERAS